MPLFGYARVSTRDQDLALQVSELALPAAPRCSRRRRAVPRPIGRSWRRSSAGLSPATCSLSPASIAWRARRGTCSTCSTSCRKRGAGFRSLKDNWADTTTPHGKLMLTVLGGLAEFERSLIAARTGEGRKRAQERGVRFGRPRKLTAHQRQEVLQRIAAGETQADIARLLNVSPPTISRLAAASPFVPAAAGL